MKTKIKGRYVIGYDGQDHVIIENGEVVYENDRIIYVGKNYKGNVDELKDVGNSIISPGFIDLNALGDIDHDLVHLEAGSKLSKNLLWSEEYIKNNHREVMTEEEEAFKSLYAYSQLILNGITTAMPITSVFYKKWAETYKELEAAAENAAKLGLRIYLGPSYQAGIRIVKPNGEIAIHWDEEAGLKGLEEAVEFVKKYDNTHNGLIRGMLAPERIESQTTETLKKTKKYSEDLGCPIKLHAAQGEFEYKEIQKRHGKSPIQYLNDIGFLGSNVGIPHGHFASGFSGIEDKSDKDLDILKETDTTVIHCPLIIGRHGTALETFGRYYNKGINMSIGTDTYPPDFIQNIRTASMISRVLGKELVGSTYADVFRAATIGGAKFLKRDDLGRLSEGAKADIIVIDMDGYHVGPIDDPLRTMIISCSNTDIKLTIIDGKIVMEDRKVINLDIDEKEMKEKMQQYFEKLKNSYIERDYQHLSKEELFPTSFKKI